LEDYNRQIEELKRDMVDATHGAENIRNDISALTQRYAVIKRDETCQICGERILAPRGMHGALGAARSYSSLVAPFYVFPCEHAFHADCLTDYVIKHTDKSERDRIRGLLRQLTALGNQEPPITTGSKTSAETAPADGRPSPIDQLRAQLDDAVAGECPFCGELMIKEIGQAFIGSEDSDLVVSWALP
jgi:ribosomal protein S27E